MKRYALPILKVVVTLSLGVVVILLVDLSAFHEELREISLPTVAVVVAIKVLATGIFVVRWQRVLSLIGYQIPAPILAIDSLVAAFYNQLLPTSVGGDVVRAYRSGSYTKRISDAWAAVLYERLVGLISLVAIPAVGLLFIVDVSPVLQITVLVSAVVLFVLYYNAHLPFTVIETLVRRFVPQAADFCGEISEVLSGPLATSQARSEVFVWCILFQMATLAMLVAVAFDLDAPEIIGAILVGVPIALLLSTIPISIGGFGLREFLFVAVLAEFGVSREQALVLAAVWFASLLATALIGMLVLLFERYVRPDRREST